MCSIQTDDDGALLRSYNDLPIGVVRFRQERFVFTPDFVNQQAEAMFGLRLDDVLQSDDAYVVLARYVKRSSEGGRIKRRTRGLKARRGRG